MSDLNKCGMKSLVRNLLTASLALAMVSCSCAIYRQSWESGSGKKISNASFHRAAKECGFRSHHTSMLGYEKRGVYFSYADDGRLSLYSSFCPNPFTLVTWGADADAWEVRCKNAEESIKTWYVQRGVVLKEVSAFPPIE